MILCPKYFLVFKINAQLILVLSVKNLNFCEELEYTCKYVFIPTTFDEVPISRRKYLVRFLSTIIHVRGLAEKF